MGPSSAKNHHKNQAKELSYRDIEDENGKDKLALDAPFIKDNFNKVQEKFCLPPATSWAIRSTHSHFEQHMMNIPDTITIGL
jgi:hypothetical protein